MIISTVVVDVVLVIAVEVGAGLCCCWVAVLTKYCLKYDVCFELFKQLWHNLILNRKFMLIINLYKAVKTSCKIVSPTTSCMLDGINKNQ